MPLLPGIGDLDLCAILCVPPRQTPDTKTDHNQVSTMTTDQLNKQTPPKKRTPDTPHAHLGNWYTDECFPRTDWQRHYLPFPSSRFSHFSNTRAQIARDARLDVLV